MAQLYTHNKNAFSEITSESAYWAGFIAADGCIFDNKRLIIGLSDKDYLHLERFKNFIEYTGPLRVMQNNAYVIDINAAYKVCTDLTTTYNITPKKSKTLVHPNITEKNHIRSFIVGYIDGDGCIRKRTNSDKVTNPYLLKVIGTYDILSWIKLQFNTIVDFKSKVDIKFYRSIFEYTITNKPFVTVYKDLMSVNVPRMERKWNLC